MAELQWTAYDTIVSYLSTEMDALADDANVLGAAIDFTEAGTDRKMYLDVEINLASIDLSAQTNPAINIWLLARTDGTNYEDGTASVDPARMPDKVVPLREISAAQRVFARFLLTTPDQGKILIENKSGAALASTGNTVKYYNYSEQLV